MVKFWKTTQVIQKQSEAESKYKPYLLIYPLRTVLVISSLQPMSLSPSPNTARWTLLSSTTPVSSGWPSRSLPQPTSLLWNRQATSRGRSTWSSCPPRGNGQRLVCRRARVLSSRKHSSFPGWNRRPLGTTLFASACTASGGWKRRKSWGKKCSTWLSSTYRERSLFLSPWSPALNSQWGDIVNLFSCSCSSVISFTLSHIATIPPCVLSRQGCGSMVSVSRSAGALSYRSTEDSSLPEILLGLIYNSATGQLSAEVIQGSHFKTTASDKPVSKYKSCHVQAFISCFACCKYSPF